MYFDYFARKDYGDDYLTTETNTIANNLQHLCMLSINRLPQGLSVCFWNISLYDKPYFDSMFGSFVFPDMTKPSWDSLEKL